MNRTPDEAIVSDLPPSMVRDPEPVIYYSIHHTTTLRYSAPVSQSVMELRARPRSDSPQLCLQFHIHTLPRTHVSHFHDHQGNAIACFDLPNHHRYLSIVMDSFVALHPIDAFATLRKDCTWKILDSLNATHVFWDWLEPSSLTLPGDLLEATIRNLELERESDPLQTALCINTAVSDLLDYMEQPTPLPAAIDEILTTRSGAAPEFTHVMIALCRRMGLPARYVSGYLFQSSQDTDLSGVGALHAWAEVYLPSIGWVGFDPTNNLVAYDRHIRVAIGRDAQDVLPMRSIFRGDAQQMTELAVRVARVPSTVAEEVQTLPTISADWIRMVGEQYENRASVTQYVA